MLKNVFRTVAVIAIIGLAQTSATAEEALRLAEQGDAKSVAGIKQRLGLYHLGKVFRAGGSKALPRDGAGSGGGGEKGSLSQ